jgi:hypothetical protein
MAIRFSLTNTSSLSAKTKPKGEWNAIFQEAFNPQSRPTKRVAVGGDSAAFSGFFYAQAESCSRSLIYARPTATAKTNRWAASL